MTWARNAEAGEERELLAPERGSVSLVADLANRTVELNS